MGLFDKKYCDICGDMKKPASVTRNAFSGCAFLRFSGSSRGVFRLKMNGWLFLEHGYNQAEDVKSMLVKYGFTCVQSWQDLAGINRVSGG